MKLYVSIFDTMNVFDCDSLFLLVIKGSRYRTAIYDRAVPYRDRGRLGHVGQNFHITTYNLTEGECLLEALPFRIDVNYFPIC